MFQVIDNHFQPLSYDDEQNSSQTTKNPIRKYKKKHKKNLTGTNKAYKPNHKKTLPYKKWQPK